MGVGPACLEFVPVIDEGGGQRACVRDDLFGVGTEGGLCDLVEGGGDARYGLQREG